MIHVPDPHPCTRCGRELFDAETCKRCRIVSALPYFALGILGDMQQELARVLNWLGEQGSFLT